MSCVDKDEDVSLSAKLRIKSTNDGTDPVVKPLTRGMVTVGGAACAVYGIAAPSRIRLFEMSVWSLEALHTRLTFV